MLRNKAFSLEKMWIIWYNINIERSKNGNSKRINAKPTKKYATA